MTIICEWCGEKQAFWKEKGKGNVVKYCGDCKEEGMIKGDSRMCEKDGCGRIAFFNFKGETIEYCIGLLVEEDRVIMTYSCWDRTTQLAIYDKTYINDLLKYS